MEFLHDEEMFLVIKVLCEDPGEYESVEKSLPLTLKTYDKKKQLLTFAFPPGEIDSLLSRFSSLYPQAEILETGLASNPERTGYVKQFTDQITIVSPGTGVEALDDEIIINSSLSFGSGFHPTTELCIRLLEQAFSLRKIERVFDLGTGSGVLALAAARLGARKILAADIDYRACQEAMENVMRNKETRRVCVVCSSYWCAGHEVFDLLLANLTISTILTLGRGFPPLMKPGGLMVLSGFTCEQCEHVMNVLSATQIIEQIALEGWAGLLVRSAL